MEAFSKAQQLAELCRRYGFEKEQLAQANHTINRLLIEQGLFHDALLRIEKTSRHCQLLKLNKDQVGCQLLKARVFIQL